MRVISRPPPYQSLPGAEDVRTYLQPRPPGPSPSHAEAGTVASLPPIPMHDNTFSPPLNLQRDNAPAGAPADDHTLPHGDFGTDVMEEIPEQILESLHPVYYCLYAGSRIIPSIRPVDHDHPALSFFFIEHVPPPTTAQVVIRHICTRENLNADQATLYGGEGTINEPADLARPTQIPENQTISADLTHSGSRNSPYQIVLKGSDERRWEARPRTIADMSFSGLVDTPDMHRKLRANVTTAREAAGMRDHESIMSGDLQEVFYRLYWESRCVAMPTVRPYRLQDPSISRMYAQHVPPPRSTRDYANYIGAQEGIHPSRIKIYQANQAQVALAAQPVVTVELPDGAVGLSSSIVNPLLVTVKTGQGADGEANRVEAFVPLRLYVQLWRRYLGWRTRSPSSLAQALREPRVVYLAQCVVRPFLNAIKPSDEILDLTDPTTIQMLVAGFVFFSVFVLGMRQDGKLALTTYFTFSIVNMTLMTSLHNRNRMWYQLALLPMVIRAMIVILRICGWLTTYGATEFIPDTSFELVYLAFVAAKPGRAVLLLPFISMVMTFLVFRLGNF